VRKQLQAFGEFACPVRTAHKFYVPFHTERKGFKPLKQKESVKVRKGRNGFNVYDVGIGIPQGFEKNGFRIGPESFLEIFRRASVHKASFNSNLFENAVKKSVGTAATLEKGNTKDVVW
jgi:hypothetical protein